MVAQIMFFALGFLLASLIALAVLPALNARAKRLARRRVEALLPMSLDEIDAERDLIRAESAVAENRKDQVISRKNNALHRQMLELSRNRSEIETLKSSLAALEEELQAERNRTAEIERKAGSTGDDAIAAQNSALSRRIEELADQIMAQGQPAQKNGNPLPAGETAE